MNGKESGEGFVVVEDEEIVAIGTLNFFDGEFERVGSMEIIDGAVKVFFGAVGFFDLEGVESFSMNDAFDFDEDFPDIPFLVMQAGDDKIVDRHLVREWFNYCPSSEKHYKEWPKLYHEIFNEPEREDVFQYAKTFVEARLRNIGYII